ncbi:hypothetical protein KFE25_000420 [Diacronema lutheri]|uniref:DUF155 domain-containing protein n=2 Tax=Diacronema lutheri TaxID=2081491 RepID=A0A8J5XV74_DIALT|nr:hypothetical protein KFE25_000420 [Diacronema lutheri]
MALVRQARALAPGAVACSACGLRARALAAARLLSAQADARARAVEENMVKTKRRRAKVAREQGGGRATADAGDDGIMRCCAYAVPFDYAALESFLRRSEHVVAKLPGVNDAMHVRLPPTLAPAEAARDDAPADAFVFDSGAVVLWGMTWEQERALIDVVRGFARGEPSARAPRSLLSRLFASAPVLAGPEPAVVAKAEQTEAMDWVYRTDGNRTSELRRDVIRVARADEQSDDEVLDRLAFSYALMQTVKLAHVEEQVDTTLDAMRGMSVQLARTGRANFISYVQLNQHIGQVMQLREFNLDSDIVETPDYFWEDSAREEMYQRLHRELEITPRSAMLNRKLSLTQESLQNVNAVIVNVHSTRLEANILYFVAFEACLSAAHLFGFLPEGGLKLLLVDLLYGSGG